MTGHLVDDRLHDLVDGLLPESERPDVEQHLTVCAECRERLERLQDLLGKAGAAPRAIAPPGDWWPAIRETIDQRKVISLGQGGNRSGVSRPWWTRAAGLAVAAILLVAATATVTAVLVRQDPAPEPIAVDAGVAPNVGTPRLAAIIANYEGLSQQLLVDFETQRSALPPEAVAQVEQNLAVIDAAIREIVGVLETEPDNETLLELLTTSYRQKVAVLEHATEAVS
ncbi:MAG: zf-HC2 domain-containing protein [Gemmatimonadales bacterium]|nr:zf-HC2 domain-containing protein [Gemmatimonadales bacterium]